jgi:hypothetical protein
MANGLTQQTIYQEDRTVESKRLPGIPDRTLQNIADSTGGVLTPYLNGNNKRIKLVLGAETFDAENNTALLKQVFNWVSDRATPVPNGWDMVEG